MLQKGGEDKLAGRWSRTFRVCRASRCRRLPLQAIFKADVQKLPAYVGVEVGGGNYMLYKIMKVKPAGENR